MIYQSGDFIELYQLQDNPEQLTDEQLQVRAEDCFARVVQSLGFPLFRIVSVTPTSLAAHAAKNFVSFYFSNFPKDWERLYEVKAYLSVDPRAAIIESLSDSGEIEFIDSWENLFAHGLESAKDPDKKTLMQELIDDADKHGLTYGLTYVKKVGVSYFVIALASEEIVDAEQITAMLDPVRIMTRTLVEIFSRANKINTINTAYSIEVEFSARQIEVLRFFYNSPLSTAKDASAKLFVTVHTINFHLRSIREITGLKRATPHAQAQLLHSHLSL